MSVTSMTTYCKILTGQTKKVYNTDSYLSKTIWITLMNQYITRTNIPYFIMILFVGMVSAHDNTLSFIYRDVLAETEENPLGLYIINNYGVYHFIELKMTGTLICVVSMFGLMKTKYKVCITCIFLFQLWLFYYITFTASKGAPFWSGIYLLRQTIDFCYRHWMS